MSLEARDALPVYPKDAIWLDDGLITLTETPDGATQLDHWNADRTHFNRQFYPGAPVRIFEHGSGYVVVTQPGPTPAFQIYVPGDDPDGDGVANPEDAFPLDPAASVDSDADGYPDAWNPGSGPGDSTEGLQLDAFPLDSACWLASQGSGGECDIEASIPDYDPAEIALGADDVVYLLSPENSRIYRWSLSEGRHLNPLVIGSDARSMAYSVSMHQLYVAYASRAITHFDLGVSEREQPFAASFMPPLGLAVADPYVFAFLGIGGRSNDAHQTFALDGESASFLPNAYRSIHWEWSASDQRLYSMDGGAVQWDLIDPDSGAITGIEDGPGSSTYTGPIRVTPDGSRLLLASGQIFDVSGMVLVRSLPGSFAEAAWLGDDVLTLRVAADGASTLLEHWNDALAPVDFGLFPGAPLRLLQWSGGVAVVTLSGSRPAFHAYVSSNDADGDGVINGDDAFPLDPAASVDTDHDGHPDAWNPDYGPGDSTLGLVLDLFPLDSACWLAEHGAGGVCDIAAQIPPYEPDQIVIGDDDIVYLLSRDESRIFRWDAAESRYLNPIVLGASPRCFAYSADLDRLYVGYSDRRINAVELAANLLEHPFAVLHHAAGGLVPAEENLFAVSGSNRYVYRATGELVHWDTQSTNTTSHVWNGPNQRV